MQEIKADRLQVKIFTDDKEMGLAAADFSAKIIGDSLKSKGIANIIIATGASQFTFYEALREKELDWSNITVFHLDEYVGMSDQHPASFRKYLKERILDLVKPREVHFLNGDASDPEKEVRRYESLLEAVEIDLACIGIGENGHIAFNDPPVADFEDPRLVKIVELDSDCRQQQLGEGWFPTFEDVPTHALSLTVPGIMRAKVISCVVPDKRKALAVYNTVHAEISEKCPATILRTHPDCTLFLDPNSARELARFRV
jgi:glucosamine-6-phosphate deaminase